MNKKKLIFTILIVLVITSIGTIAGCLFSYVYNHTLPKKADEVLVDYMESFKLGTNEAVQYAHFKNEEIKEAYLNAGTILYDYRIEDITRINDNLFALTVLVKTNRTSDSYMRVYNFLGYIDGSWRFMNGIGNVPDEISDNLERDAYSYK